MKRIINIAVAASILAAVCSVASWIMIRGSSSGIAFAAVAEALDRLRSATFDVTSEIEKDSVGVSAKTKGSPSRPRATVTGRGYFLAPSRQRTEIATDAAKHTMGMVMIADHQTGKGLVLMPNEKFAMTTEMAKMREDMKKSAKGAPPDLFETARRLVREGSGGAGEKVERLGQKEIDGHAAVGFRTHSNMADMTLWADPKTARPIRIELASEMFAEVRMVMNNFRYDVALDPSLFSLEPPAGYSTQALNVATPVEQDFLKILRTVAEHSKGLFPAKLGMNKETMEPLMAVIKPEMTRLETKHGIKPKPGQQAPPAMMADAMKTLMPLVQKEMQGIMFYVTLKPENDAHYVGGGVKLGTPDRPIFWYRPTRAEKYRVIYADLSVKEMSAEEVKKLP